MHGSSEDDDQDAIDSLNIKGFDETGAKNSPKLGHDDERNEYANDCGELGEDPVGRTTSDGDDGCDETAQSDVGDCVTADAANRRS